jgi:hypothetical protein
MVGKVKKKVIINKKNEVINLENEIGFFFISQLVSRGNE